MPFPYTEKWGDITETRVIALIGHLDRSEGGPHKTGLRFKDDPDTLHTVLHECLDECSALEVKMLERGDACEIVSQTDGQGGLTIRKIRFVRLRTP